jgi:plastocyanin
MKNTSRMAAMGLAICAGCAGEPLRPAAPAPPPAAAAEAGSTTPSAPTAIQGSGARGSIVGTVATNPWRAIKAGAVVYLEDGPRETAASPSATLDNHDMAFVPYIAVVPAGGSVLFTNTDPLMHNVFTPDADKWNLGEIPQNGTVVKRFDAAATYTILCNLHPHMVAYLVVTPSSYFARTDADGSYAIKNVPPGTYRVTAWAPRLKPGTRSVTLTEGETTANFDLQR